MKQLFFLILCFFVLSCGNNKTQEITTDDQNSISNEPMHPADFSPGITIDPQKAEVIIKKRLFEILEIIKKKEINKLIPYIHPEKGIRFSLSQLVNPDEQILYRKDFENYEMDSKEYTWGHFEQTGEPIKYTKAEYLKRKFSYNYKEAVSITYNEMRSPIQYPENQWLNYPESIIVEIYFEGKDSKYNWVGQRLVFQEYQGEWYLVGTLYNTWSP